MYLSLLTCQFHRTIDTNLKGTFFLTRAAVPHIPKGGAIIITASQVAYAGPPSLVDYSMTKGAQVSFMRCLSNQLIGEGIRVNCVCPGPVWTPLQEAAMHKDTLSTWLQNPAPIGRVGQPAELGPAYVFLASADGSFVSSRKPSGIDPFSDFRPEYPRQRWCDCLVLEVLDSFCSLHVLSAVYPYVFHTFITSTRAKNTARQRGWRATCTIHVLSNTSV